jgi:hypothetical protein
MHTNKKMPVEVYSRVVGYYRPVDQWNRGKQAEFSERKEISVSSIKTALYAAETNISVRSE